jgi:hypothetical protein
MRRPVAPMGTATFRLFPADGSVVVIEGATWTQARVALAQACNVSPATLVGGRYIRSAAQESFKLPGGNIAALRDVAFR